MSWVRYATRCKFLLASMAAGAVLMMSAPLAAAAPPGPDPLIAPIGVTPAPPAATPSRIRLDIDQLTPRVVRADSGGITVAGRVTNTGDRRIEEIETRLQRGEALNTETKLRDAMAQPPSTETVRPGFIPISKSLEPGTSASFKFTVPLDALRLDEPGVYPVLINVNGRPAFGNPERLAGLNVLLPVVSTPSRAVSPPPSPSRITLLWPLADDHPRVLQQTVGKQAVLSDDDLATSLSVGGRLYGMINTVKTAITANNSLPSSICYAVDGDLLNTVKSMEDGYQVRMPDGRTVPGKGQAFAQRWLADVKTLANGRCVIALPYADADLSALSRTGAADLAKNAVDQGFSTVASILSPVQPQQGVIWPTDGTLDQRARIDLTGSSPTTVLANPERLKGISGVAPYTIGQNRAVLIDQLVSSSLRGTVPGPVSVQNGLAALVFRTALHNEPGQSVLIAPPRRWTASAGEQAVYLQTISQLYTDKLANPQVLPDLISAPAKGTASGLDYPQQDAAAELPGQLMTEITQSNAVQRDLFGAMDTDDTNRIDPDELIAPIRRGLLRATSSAWRADIGGALGMSADVREQLDSMRAQVTVGPPGPPISLASSSSPIPVRIGNTLPVAVNVRFVISESSGLRPASIPNRRISGHSSITVIIPAELLRAGKFTLDVWLTTAGGTSLGTTSRIEISSTSYGTITVAVTGVAGGVLVLLAGRRIYRRGKDKSKSEREQSPV
jgi:hypothetical protein